MSLSVDGSDRTPRRSLTFWIGLAAILVWMIGWTIAAFVYGRPLRYIPNDARAVTMAAQSASISIANDHLVVSEVDGWRVQITRIDPKSTARVGPDATDLEILTRQAIRESQGRQRDPQQGPPKGMERPDAAQSPVQQYRQPKQESADSLAYEAALPPRAAVSVAPDGSSVAWVVGNTLFTSRPRRTAAAASAVLTALPTTIGDVISMTRLRSPRCVPEFGRSMLVLACERWLEIRDPRTGRPRWSTDGRFRTLRTAEGALFAANGSDLFPIPESGDALGRRVELKSAPRVLTQAPSGDLAVGTEDGEVVLVAAGGATTTITAPGAVDALAFMHTGDTLVVGGAFRGIHIVRPGGRTEPLIPDVIGTRFLHATAPAEILYATTDRVALTSWTTGRAWSTRGYLFGGIALLPIALVLGLAVVGLTAARTPDSQSAAPAAAPAPQPREPDLVLPLPDPPDGLVKACLAGECVLYAGGGLSAAAGYPTWQRFVEDLLNSSAESGAVDRSFAESLRTALAAGQLDPVADSLVSAIGKPGVMERLRETYGRDQPLTDAHRLLKQIPFSAALTGNLDTLLERTYPDVVDRVLTPRSAERIVELLGRREFFIAKLYGSLSDPESVVLTGADYSEVIARNLPFSQSMEGLFVSRTLFFAGASLEAIETYLSGLTFRGQMTRTHYALVAVSDAGWRAKADLLRRRYGIEVLPYTRGPAYEEMPRFLDRLRGAVTAAEDPAGAAQGSRSSAEGLRRLHLQNIGPFPELTLDLQSDWNVILGDNGVGKSSILKAIATCFCGRDATPYASRLIRSGEPAGSIVVETARNTYRMELRRKDNGAEISIVPARPLDVEGGLALGFPPLRAVSWDRPKGPTAAGQRRPAVEDLMPIVKGDPDPRLDRLKQWIVNLDARINYERSHGGDDRYERLLTRFFEIVDRVTPGMSIRFGRVNQDTREVTVVTDDGEIPIELISQGSVSLMGWIGVLLQRMYEVYGDDQDPTGRYALVLIDEIDAHMHPEWQQCVVEDMTAIFPNVQYIATTHSPLVVGGMEGRQVMRFARSKQGQTTRVPVTDEMLVGRADQILTGRLFGMKTTLDQQTQRAMDRYKVLLGKQKRDAAEEEEFHKLNRELKFKIPIAEETGAERKALALVEAIINDQLSAIVPQARQPIIDKARALIHELGAEEKSAL